MATTKTKAKKAAKRRPALEKVPARRAVTKKAAAASPLEFNHAMIYVTDIERSLEFYRDLLGFRVVDTYPGAYARLQSPRGTTTIALHLAGKESSFNPKTEGMRLYFEVERLDAFCKKLDDMGVAIAEPPKDMPWGWRHAYLLDPDGHEISLYWAGKKRFQPTKMK